MKAGDTPIADELSAARDAGIKVGIGGWNFPPWRDNFYPKGLPQRRELEYASRHLAAIEINSTFYRAQTAKVYAKWRDETPPGFVFSLKAPRQIAEVRKLSGAGALIRGFLFGAWPNSMTSSARSCGSFRRHGNSSATTSLHSWICFHRN